MTGPSRSLDAESDRSNGPRRRGEKFPHRGEQRTEIRVVRRDLALQRVEFGPDLGLVSREVAKSNERAHDKETHLDRAGTPENGSGHDRPVLRKRPRRTAPPPSSGH